MQLYVSLDLETKEFCYIKQHDVDKYTWSFWSDRSKGMDLTVSHPAFAGNSSNSSLIEAMRREGYPTFSVPNTSYATYNELYPIYLQHRKDNPHLFI